MNRRTIIVAAAAGVLVVSAGSAIALAANDRSVNAADSLALQPTVTSSTTTSTTGDTSSTSTSPTSSSSSSSVTPAGPGLGPDDAVALVQKRLGGGQVHEVEREHEHGRLEWKVEITKDGVTYDIRVDASSGEVTRVETDDDDSDDRDDDRYDDDRDDDRHGDDDDWDDDRDDDKGGDR
ncbi:hypothetical protein BLA60_06490 [Actinophytocola xinjiangensis]|uniref:PepSY domain-containing protein n=1 Tax=Actinophytocola xinjiangensis TaxID=485602 RepID=A0A7Z0WRC7_9PSEU|nr:PepSY domain-containing protein [Actinophytocola xinjiangensis]OLF12900.1 hypothetical protein BLA60_06490 [Actinophytocola xinjiangensis]